MFKGFKIKSKIILFRRNELISIFLFILFFIIFSNISEGFFSSEMLYVILLTGAELATITIGVTLLIISGEIDLSVASVFVFSNYTVLFSSSKGVPLLMCFFLALAFGAFAGFLNGFFTLRFKIPSFVVTLGFLIFWRSAVAGLTNGEPTYFKGEKTILFDYFGGQIGIFPMQFFWFLIFAVIFSALLNYTQFGNRIFATGGSVEVARALGVNTNKIKRVCFIISAMLAAFTGITFLARSSYLDPIVATGLEFEAVVSAVIGGTLLTGGAGTVVGAVICAFLLKVVQIGIGTYGVAPEYYKVVVGILLVAAAIINGQITRKIFKV